MPDLDYLFELGPELEIRLDDFSDANRILKLEIPLRAAFSSDLTDVTARGLVFAPELELEQKSFRGTPFQVDVSVAAIFGTERFLDYFYEVAPAFARSDRPAFDAGGGYLGAQFGIGVRRARGPVQIFFGGNLTSHHGAANADSPLFESELSFGLYAAVVRFFWAGKRLAPR
ncbi:hypothetical protein BH24PSE2_BH24PSE2_17060 [soil metagenome]